jgi:hypothetical protein
MKLKFRTIGLAVGALAQAAAIMAQVAPARADAQIYVLEKWPSEIDSIPCSAWKKSADGSWILNGTVKVGSSEINNVAVKGDAAARMVDKLCGAKPK